jgi:hypothetical protein
VRGVLTGYPTRKGGIIVEDIALAELPPWRVGYRFLPFKIALA